MSERRSIKAAHDFVSREFMRWAEEKERLQIRRFGNAGMIDSFLDPRNRNDWMDSFIGYLQERFQQPDRIASND